MQPSNTAQPGDWFETWAAPLALYARQWLTTEEAEDVVQEAFIRLISTTRPPANTKGWLFRTVRNAAISRIRSSRRRREREQRKAAERGSWFEAHPEDLLDAATAQAALAALPLDQREVIVLRLWAEMTLQEAADITGQPVSTLFCRYRAGIATLRARLEAPCKTSKS